MFSAALPDRHAPFVPTPLLLGDLWVLDWSGPEFLWFYASAVAVCFAAAWLVRRQARSTHLPPRPITPDGYQLAMLAGGGSMAMSAAVASLMGRGALMWQDGKIARVSDDPVPPSHELEACVLAHVGHSMIEPRALALLCRDPLDELRRELIEARLWVDPLRAQAMQMLAMIIALAAPLLGLVKMAIGMWRDKPVGFLIIGVALATFAALSWFSRAVEGRTTAGDRVLNDARRQADRIDLAARAKRALREPRSSASPAGLTALSTPALGMAAVDPIVLAMALYGGSVLGGTGLLLTPDSFETARRHTYSGDAGGTSSTCSGADSDGGGGCGGCGGGGD